MFERRDIEDEIFCIIPPKLNIRQKNAEMKTFVGKSSEFLQRSFATYLVDLRRRRSDEMPKCHHKRARSADR